MTETAPVIGMHYPTESSPVYVYSQELPASPSPAAALLLVPQRKL